jgi:hypothetical protein
MAARWGALLPDALICPVAASNFSLIAFAAIFPSSNIM